MTLTIQEYAARALEKQAEALLKTVQETPEERREWKPLDRGRTAKDQITECAVLNGVATQMVQRQAATEDLFQEWESSYAALDTLGKAQAALRENTARLASAIRATPDDALEMPIVLPWMTLTLAEAFLLPLWNMSYHEGQINYIRILGEEAVPPA